MYGLPDSVAGYYAKRYLRSVKNMRAGRGRIASGFGINFALSKVIIYKSQTHRILNTPSGKLWWALNRRGEAIVRDAKAQVGVKTGALKRSIHMRHLSNVTGQYLWIGSKKHYAYIHHEGSSPHTITPKEKPLLVFRSGARVIRTLLVEHPGTRPNRYLTTPMRKHVVRPINIR